MSSHKEIFRSLIKEGQRPSFKDYLTMVSEGVWAIPHTTDKASRLRDLFQNELPARMAGEKLYNLMGDDELYDQLGKMRDENPNQDVRPFVKQHLDNWINSLDVELDGGLNNSKNKWSRNWDKDAVDILRKIENEEKSEDDDKENSYLQHRNAVRTAAIRKQRGEM